jgi:hypothetical protein
LERIAHTPLIATAQIKLCPEEVRTRCITKAGPSQRRTVPAATEHHTQPVSTVAQHRNNIIGLVSNTFVKVSPTESEQSIGGDRLIVDVSMICTECSDGESCGTNGRIDGEVFAEQRCIRYDSIGSWYRLLPVCANSKSERERTHVL